MASGSPRSSRPTIAEAVVLALAFAVGLAQRWWVLAGPLGYVDLDEAAVGLAAQRFLEHPQVFFPGQPYGGTIETALVVLVQAIGGSGPIAVKVTAMALHLLACVLVWRVGVRLIPGRLGALAAPVLLWCGPAMGIWESTKARGFYGAGLVLTVVVLLLVLRIDERTSIGDLVSLGLVVGLGWWTTPLVVLTVIPAVAWLVARDPERWRLGAIVAPAAIVGALPWIGWNALHGWASLRQPADFGADVGHRFGDGVAKLALLTGIETPWNPERTLFPAGRIIAVVVLAGLLTVATSRTLATAPGFLAAVTIGYLVLYPLSSSAGSVGADPRYLYLLLPAVSLVLAAAVPAVPDRVVPAALAGLVVAAAALSAWGLVGLEAARDQGPNFLDAPGIPEVVDRLESRGVRRVVTDVAGTQITYATDGRIEASSFAVPRFDDLERNALVQEPTTYVLQRDLFGNDARLERHLRRRGIRYRREDIGIWTVISAETWVPPWAAGLVSLGVPVRPPD